jgi:hypothetical protein
VQYSNASIFINNCFFKNATYIETTDTGVLGPMLKCLFIPGKAYILSISFFFGGGGKIQ